MMVAIATSLLMLVTLSHIVWWQSYGPCKDIYLLVLHKCTIIVVETIIGDFWTMGNGHMQHVAYH